MPGFPLAAIGAGLGLFAKQYQEQQAAAERNKMLQMQLALFQQQMQDRQGQNELANLDPSILSGTPSVQPTPGGASAVPPIGGGMPFAQKMPAVMGSRPSNYTPPPDGSGFSSGLQKLISLGVAPEVAQGAVAYMSHNESKSPFDVNPTSGAFGRAQWLGPRKRALLGQYGRQPGDEQQAEFMGSELTGSEARTLDQLRSARTAQEGYDIWGRSFERPGQDALRRAGVGGALYQPPTNQIRQQWQQTYAPPAVDAPPVPQARGDVMPGTERTPNAEALAWRHEVDAQELADPTGSRFNAPSGQQMAQAGPQTATDAGPQGDLAAAEQAELAKIPMPKAGNTDLGTMYRTIRERAPNATAPQIQQYIHNMVAQRGPEVTRQFEIEMKQHEEQVATVREKYRQLREQQKEDRTGQGVITGPDDNQYVRHGDVAHPLTVQGTGEQIGKSEKLSKPTLLEYTGEDGKVERVEAQHIESGPKKGQWVTADQLRAPIDVSKGKWSIISGGAANALGGARDAAQRERQIIAGREIQSDLENIVKLPVATTRGIFGSRTPGPGLFDALKEDLAETMTSEDAELAQSALAGLERELSIITSPVYGGKWAAESFAPLKLKEGQTVFVKLYNIARMRQTADNALEAMTKSPRIGEDQKKYAAEMRTMLDKAIPWLPNDVMAFRDQAKREGRERPEDKGESFGEFVAKHGIGGAAKRGAEGEAGTAGAQEDVAHDPKTGQEYVKRNGQWVPR